MRWRNAGEFENLRNGEKQAASQRFMRGRRVECAGTLASGRSRSLAHGRDHAALRNERCVSSPPTGAERALSGRT